MLVVIAIIGILSSIVLISLNSARQKGTDTKIISDVGGTRTQLESDFTSLYTDLYNTAANATNVPGSLTTNSNGYANLTMLAADAASNTSQLNYVVKTNGIVGNVTTPNVTAYAIYGQLVSSSTEYFCLDSSGRSDQTIYSNNTITCP